jgi:hypothetical protein
VIDLLGEDERRLDDKAAVLRDVCAALSSDRLGDASDILRERYAFAPMTNVGRHYSERQMLKVFAQDGFIDRYSGARLVCPATLRLISTRLPEAFPFHRNWRVDACHFAYWELCPTVDHMLPVSRGGTDDASNWITTSMVRNAAKAGFTLDELGWSLHSPGNMADWDGLLGWFIDQANADRLIRADPYLRRWFSAAKQLGECGSVWWQAKGGRNRWE